MERFESFDLTDDDDDDREATKQIGRAGVVTSSLSAELEASSFSYGERNYRATDEFNLMKLRWDGAGSYVSYSDCSISYNNYFDKFEGDEIHEDSHNDDGNDEDNDDGNDEANDEANDDGNIIIDDNVLSAGNLIRVIINNQFIFQETLFDSDDPTSSSSAAAAAAADIHAVDDEIILIKNIRVAEVELGYVSGVLSEEVLCKQHLLIAAAEDDGSLMDDLPSFSSHTDILETGISDFNLLYKSAKDKGKRLNQLCSLLHVRIELQDGCIVRSTSSRSTSANSSGKLNSDDDDHHDDECDEIFRIDSVVSIDEACAGLIDEYGLHLVLDSPSADSLDEIQLLDRASTATAAAAAAAVTSTSTSSRVVLVTCRRNGANRWSSVAGIPLDSHGKAMNLLKVIKGSNRRVHDDGKKMEYINNNNIMQPSSSSVATRSRDIIINADHCLTQHPPDSSDAFFYRGLQSHGPLSIDVGLPSFDVGGGEGGSRPLSRTSRSSTGMNSTLGALSSEYRRRNAAILRKDSLASSRSFFNDDDNYDESDLLDTTPAAVICLNPHSSTSSITSYMSSRVATTTKGDDTSNAIPQPYDSMMDTVVTFTSMVDPIVLSSPRSTIVTLSDIKHMHHAAAAAAASSSSLTSDMTSASTFNFNSTINGGRTAASSFTYNTHNHNHSPSPMYNTSNNGTGTSTPSVSSISSIGSTYHRSSAPPPQQQQLSGQQLSGQQLSGQHQQLSGQQQQQQQLLDTSHCGSSSRDISICAAQQKKAFKELLRHDSSFDDANDSSSVDSSSDSSSSSDGSDGRDSGFNEGMVTQSSSPWRDVGGTEGDCGNLQVVSRSDSSSYAGTYSTHSQTILTRLFSSFSGVRIMKGRGSMGGSSGGGGSSRMLSSRNNIDMINGVIPEGDDEDACTVSPRKDETEARLEN